MIIIEGLLDDNLLESLSDDGWFYLQQLLRLSMCRKFKAYYDNPNAKENVKLHIREYLLPSINSILLNEEIDTDKYMQELSNIQIEHPRVYDIQHLQDMKAQILKCTDKLTKRSKLTFKKFEEELMKAYDSNKGSVEIPNWPESYKKNKTQFCERDFYETAEPLPSNILHRNLYKIDWAINFTRWQDYRQKNNIQNILL